MAGMDWPASSPDWNCIIVHKELGYTLFGCYHCTVVRGNPTGAMGLVRRVLGGRR